MKQNVSHISKREMLDAIKTHLNMSKNTDFARFLGISSQAVSNWYARNTFDAELLYTKCDFINPAWLLTGAGSMLKEPSDQRVSEVAHPVPAGTHAGIPLIPLNAMAGAFTGDLSVLDYECEHYVIPDFQGADFLIRVKGDSMQPTYYAGDLIACQHVPLDDLFFQWGKAYVLDTTQGPLIKRIRPGKDNEHILIISDNTAYPPFELARDQFHGVALVRGLVRLE